MTTGYKELKKPQHSKQALKRQDKELTQMPRSPEADH